MSFVAFAILTRVIVWPRLRLLSRADALLRLVIPHTFRLLLVTHGLMFWVLLRPAQ
jgi:hypothetical protein